MTRALLAQARDLVDDPGRSDGWVADDVPLVRSTGRQSMSIVEAFGVAAGTLEGLDAALAAPGGRFLDGHPWTPVELVEMVAKHGFEDAAELPRAWGAPVGLYVGPPTPNNSSR